jgi:hypothetical protein
MGRQPPAQMPGTAFTLLPIAQQKQRCLAGTGPKAEAPAGGKVEHFGFTFDLGNHSRNRAAGNHLLGSPQKLGHVCRADDNQPSRIDPEPIETWTIGKAECLAFLGQLHIKNAGPAGIHQSLGLRQGKAQACAAIPNCIAKNFLHEATGQDRETGSCRSLEPLPRLQQGWFSFNISNGMPQRGKALLLALGRHDRPLSEQNRNMVTLNSSRVESLFTSTFVLCLHQSGRERLPCAGTHCGVGA